MHRIRLVVLAFAGVLVVGLMAFASMASAADPVGILPDPIATKPVTFNVGSPEKGILETLAGTKVECEKLSGSGEASTLKLGKVTFKFQGCKETVFNTKCTTPKEAEGTIIAKGEFHTWFALLSKAQQPAVVVLAEETSFTCDFGIAKVIVKGCVAGLVLEPNTLKKAYKIDFLKIAGTKGDADMPEVKKEGSEKYEACTLLTSFNGGGFESSSIIQNGEIKEAKQGGAAVEVLLMY